MDGSDPVGAATLVATLRHSPTPLAAAAFDAMTKDRPYQRGLPFGEAYDELRRHAGTQFFPEILEALNEAHQYGELDGDLDKPAISAEAPAARSAALSRVT